MPSLLERAWKADKKLLPLDSSLSHAKVQANQGGEQQVDHKDPCAA
jgi:hypothetical protein